MARQSDYVTPDGDVQAFLAEVVVAEEPEVAAFVGAVVALVMAGYEAFELFVL